MVFKGSSSDGSVEASVNGKLVLTNLELDENFSQQDINSQKNMIKIAINNAIASAQKTTQDKMNSVTGGMLGDMNIPGL